MKAGDDELGPFEHKAQLLKLDNMEAGWINLPNMPSNDVLEHQYMYLAPLPSGHVPAITALAGTKPDLFDPYDTTQGPNGSWRA